MLFSNFLRRFVWVLAAALLASARGGVPVPENFPGSADFSGPVTPVIPTAKTLILPLTAYDPDGGQLSFTAKSSNPNIFVRVRTGNPLLRLTLSHAGAASGDPAYSGDLVFPLFRQLTPTTAGWIAGLAEGGFYNGLTLHRLADLRAEISPPATVPSFVYQGGDPNGDGTGGPGFTFQNEYDPSLIYSGRGLLGMANAGYGADDRGTNGSQFFITDGRVALDSTGAIVTDGRARFLDFQYTIFGQLTHGWPLLDDLMQTPTGASRQELPNIPVTIVSAGVVPQYIDAAGHAYTDAILVLSAKGPGKANITVTVADDQVPSHTVRQTFLVEAIDDTVNDPPFLSQFVNTVAAENKTIPLPFSVVDLEHDYIDFASTVTATDLEGNPVGVSKVFNNHTVVALGNLAYVGPLDLVLQATQYDMTYRGSIDGDPPFLSSYTPCSIAIGDSSFLPEPTTIEGKAGVPLNDVVIARYRTGNLKAQASDVTAVVNWGDGSSSGTTTDSFGLPSPIANFPISAVLPVDGSLGEFEIQAGHTYTQPGVYRVLVTFSDRFGLAETAASTAVISAGPLSAVGRTIEAKGRNTGQQVVATFTDSGAPGIYTAFIDWGDGLVAKGAVKDSPSGTFTVSGAHTYVDAETFPVLVQIQKQGAATAASAWSLIQATGFTGEKHLPPFDQAHLVAQISPVRNSLGQSLPIKTTVTTARKSQTYLSYHLEVINSGNLPSNPGTVRFYLSSDKTLNLKPVLNPDGSTNPADTPLSIGPSQFRESIPALPPGHAIAFDFRKTGARDSRLTPSPNPLVTIPGSPAKAYSDVTTGSNLLAVLDYSDPLANHEPIAKTAVAGPIDGVLLDGLLDSAPAISTTQDNQESSTDQHTTSFKVRLDSQPASDVHIEFAVSDSSEGSLSTSPTPDNVPPTMSLSADPTASLTFTSANWNQDQLIYVTGVPNYNSNSPVNYSISATVSSKDHYFDGMQVPTITATNRPSLFFISPLSVIAYRTPGVPNTATFTVALAQTPSDNVSLSVTSSNPEVSSVWPAVLTFTPSNANISQTVTVTATDAADVGDVAYQINLGPDTTTLDSTYKGEVPPSVTVTNKDDPFLISPSQIVVHRTSGGSAAFTVALSRAPTDYVNIAVSVSNPAVASVDQYLLLFTTENYNVPQTVNVTAQDSTAAGDVSYQILLYPASSWDRSYDLPIPPVSATNTDN